MMNELLDQGVGVQYPEELGGTIDLQSASANCCKFNRWGSLVAVGTIDGRVFICDFLTQKIVKTLQAHVFPISTVSWSRDGRQLLTASADKTVKIWDVLEALVLEDFKYSDVILCAYFNPRNANQFVALPNNQPPHVERINPRTSKVLVSNDPSLNHADDGVFAVSYDRRGQYIITGSSKGRLVIYDAKTFRVVTWVKQSTSQQVRQIYTPRRGNYVLTNTQDRVVRVYKLEDLLDAGKGNTVEPCNKVLDIVNKAAWKVVCTDQDCNYICSASAKAHQLYIWERTTGTIVKMLNGTKGEMLLDAQWHPTRPVILSISNGQISVWTQAFVENWSAFAPDFQELEENLKYVEKEGEFDEYDEDASVEDKNEIKEEDDLDIDVTSNEPNEFLCSSDEEDVASLIPDVTLQKGPLWFLPQSEVENPEEPSLPPRDVGMSLQMQLQQRAQMTPDRLMALGQMPRRSK